MMIRLLLERISLVFITVSGLWVAPASADFASARCEIESLSTEKGILEEHCVFSQRQGYVSIALDSGPAFHLSPLPEAVGTYSDNDGKTVYRQSGLGDEGLTFRWPDRVIRVYWQREGE
jgi:hypothetical protein